MRTHEHRPTFYGDSAVVALRNPASDVSIESLHLRMSAGGGSLDYSVLADGDLAKTTKLPKPAQEQISWIEYALGFPITIRAVSLALSGLGGVALLFGWAPMETLEASEDGQNFHEVVNISGSGPSGGASAAASAPENTVAFGAVTAKYFRVTFTQPPPPPMPDSAGNIDFGTLGIATLKPDPDYEIAEVALHPGARVNHWQEKAAFVTTINLYRFATPEFGPADAIASGRTTVPLHLERWGTVFVVFRKPTKAAAHALPRTTLAQIGTVDGPWTVTFQPDRGAPTSINLDRLVSWSDSADSGVKYLSGKGTYSKTLQAPANWLAHRTALWLDLGDIRNLTVVTVNGKQFPIVWHAPYRVDVAAALKHGTDQISITVVNAWVNRLICDLQPNTTTKYTFSTWPAYKKDAPSVQSGLIGPVSILQESS